MLPALTLLLLGIFGYGQYFLLAHSAQQMANDAARATIAGLSPAERTALAHASVARAITKLPTMTAGQVAVAVKEDAGLVTVQVRLDAAANEFMRLAVVPMPDPVIERRGVVRQGGVE